MLLLVCALSEELDARLDDEGDDLGEGVDGGGVRGEVVFVCV